MRKIVRIDEEKCNGCGVCVPSCAEGALQIIDGKARLVSDIYCDGLGACLGKCPQDAITVEEREAEEFNEAAALAFAEFTKKTEEASCGSCAAANVARYLEETASAETEPEGFVSRKSQLSHWPVQLTLVPANAPFFQGADLLIAADCTAFAYPALHQDFLKDHAVVVACPKLDDAQAHMEKLAQIFRLSDIRSITILRMEVPCCSGLVRLTRMALEKSGKRIPVEEVVISADGRILTPVK